MNRLAWMVLPLLGLSSCSMAAGVIGGSIAAERASDWYETGEVRKPRAEILHVVRELILRQGYLTAEFDAAQQRAESSWDAHYSMIWREGIRTKVEAEVLPLASGGFNVRVRSIMELNDNQATPGVPERALWVGAGVSEKHKVHIPDQALKLHTLLKNRFFGMNP
jgi:hypothetical protein